MLERIADCARPKNSTRKNKILFILLLLSQIAAGASGAARSLHSSVRQTPTPQATTPQTAQSLVALVSGQSVTRELNGGQKHSYAIELVEGQFLNIEFDGRSVNANIRIFDPAGELLNLYDVAASMTGKQTIEFVTETRGSYRIDITGKPSKAPAPAYTFQLTIPRPASTKEADLARARSMYLKANALTAAGKHDEALTLTQQSLILREKHLGSEHIAIANTYHQLGVIFHAKGDYPQAVTNFSRALAIREKLYGVDSNNVSALVNNLGALYDAMGDQDKAEQFMRRAVSLQENQHIANDPTLAITLHNLGNVLESKGDYNGAEQTYERALVIKEKAYGTERPETAETVAALAAVSQEKGDYARALSLNERALTIFEEAIGEDDPRTGQTILNLANVYALMGDAARAASLDERALKILEKTLDAEHPLVAMALNNLGDSVREARDYARAEKLYLRALEIREKKLGTAHPDVGMTLENLGHLYRDKGDYDKAETFYQRALQNKEHALGTEHPLLVSTFTEMSLLYAARGDFVTATLFESRAIAAGERNADLNLRAGSERQKLAYLDLLSDGLDQAITLNVRLAPEQAAARDLAVNTVLQRKGRVQDALADSFSSLRQRLDAKDVELLDEFNHATARLAQLVLSEQQQSSSNTYRERVTILREGREHVEAEISRRSAEFRAQAQPVTLSAVRAVVPDDAALLEFVAYKPLLPKGVTRAEQHGDARYVVYVIRSRGDVRWRDLGTVKELDGAVDAWRQALREPDRKDVRQLARVVDEKVMQPVRALAGDATHLLVSPDGELNLMPFAALVDERGRYLVERYAFTYLTSGRDLLRMEVARQSKNNPVIIANPSFGETATAEQVGRNATVERSTAKGAQRRSVTDARNLSDVYFAPLDGTTQEARGIKMLFADATLLTGERATEAALKSVVAPDILHIATHGFFLQDMKATDDVAPRATRSGSGNASAQIENPLLRSGLALAGANAHHGDGSNDGILTALEASGLNLWGTKLVVLSACDTGLGEVRNGEGVYGLRRAFVLAGTQSLVMSLWPASDYSTRRLMGDYYKNLKGGMGRGAALRQVQLDMLKRDRNLHPFYWANFIQSGEWANLDGRR